MNQTNGFWMLFVRESYIYVIFVLRVSATKSKIDIYLLILDMLCICLWNIDGIKYIPKLNAVAWHFMPGLSSSLICSFTTVWTDNINNTLTEFENILFTVNICHHGRFVWESDANESCYLSTMVFFSNLKITLPNMVQVGFELTTFGSLNSVLITRECDIAKFQRTEVSSSVSRTEK